MAAAEHLFDFIYLTTVMLLVGSVQPYLTNYAYFNASVHTVSTTRCNDIRIPKVNLEVANGSL